MRSLKEVIDELEGRSTPAGFSRSANGKPAGKRSSAAIEKEAPSQGGGLGELVSMAEGEARKRRAEAFSADAGQVAAAPGVSEGDQYAQRVRAAQEQNERMGQAQAKAAQAAMVQQQMKADMNAAAVRAERKANQSKGMTR